VLLELLDRTLAIAYAAHDIVLALKVGRNGVADGLLVLDQQDLLLI